MQDWLAGWVEKQYIAEASAAYASQGLNIAPVPLALKSFFSLCGITSMFSFLVVFNIFSILRAWCWV